MKNENSTQHTPKFGERALQVANSFMPFLMHPPTVNHQPEIRDAMAVTIQKAMETYWPDLNKANTDLLKENEQLKAKLSTLQKSYSILGQNAKDLAAGYAESEALNAELLETLKKAGEQLGICTEAHSGDKKLWSVFKSVNSAIAKAEGKTLGVS